MTFFIIFLLHNLTKFVGKISLILLSYILPAFVWVKWTNPLTLIFEVVCAKIILWSLLMIILNLIMRGTILEAGNCFFAAKINIKNVRLAR